jgi:hypothetical protein
LSASAMAYELGVSDQRISRLCHLGLVPGAAKNKAAWSIPADALPAIRELLEQPVVRQPKPKPTPAPARQPEPVSGLRAPPEARALHGDAQRDVRPPSRDGLGGGV